ncbi:MAG: MaoC/PaaZ C-terminal domain-containing protein [Anaerolineales bacterium]|jgi:acyl dehydratase
MTQSEARPRGKYFEEFEVGQRIVTAGRTVTEADVVTFAGLSGDFNQMHVDAEYSAKSMFGQRVAHGLLGLSIASGLAVQTGVLEGTILAFREITEWKFSRPIFLGDTIHVVMEVKETKAMARLGGGLVGLKLSVVNQNGDTVMKGMWSTLVAFQPEAG